MSTFRLTDTRRDVLRLIAEGRPLGDYVPRYHPGARRGRGAFLFAERVLYVPRRAGIVERAFDGTSAFTVVGRAALERSE